MELQGATTRRVTADSGCEQYGMISPIRRSSINLTARGRQRARPNSVLPRAILCASKRRCSART